VASATLIVTKRNIAERQAQVSRNRGILRKLSPASPRRPAIKARNGVLLTEIAALKASLHYYKPTDQLSADIASQRRKVRGLTTLFSKTAGKRRRQIGLQLRQEAKTLNEMLAAAQLQQVQTGVAAPLPTRKPDLTLVKSGPRGWKRAVANPVGQEQEALTEEEEGGQPPPAATPAEVEAVEAASEDQPHPEFAPSEFSLEDVPEYANKALATLDEHIDELDGYTNEEGEVWYKNPIVIAGGVGVLYLLLRRR